MGGTQPMGEGDGLGDVQDDLRRKFRRGGSLGHLFLHQPGQVAALNVLVFQAGRIGSQIGLQQRHDAGVPALLHHAIQQLRLVAQSRGRGGVQAEFQRHRLAAGERQVPSLPDLAEAADAEQFDQLPIADPRRTVARLEARQASGQKRQQVFRPL